MASRLLISDGSNAREIGDGKYKVAYNALVKPIQRALVAEAGIAHQYYPPVGASTDPNILWTQQPLTAREYSLIANQPSNATIGFAVDGSYGYTNDTDVNTSGTGNGTWLAIPVTATGQYLIRADLVSGSGTIGTLATWIDAFTPPQFGATLATVGVNQVVMDITVARGSVTPDAGTEVTKRVTFIANVVDEGTNITWNQTPWFLEDIKENVDAVCQVAFFANGTAYGREAGGDVIQQNWHKDATNVPDPDFYFAQAVLVSGTAPTGSPLGVDLGMDTNPEWTLATTAQGEDLTCVLDITVNDFSVFVTKRVTLHSVRDTAPSTLIWTTTSWSLLGTAFDPDSAVGRVVINNDGTAEGTASGAADINEDWKSNPPDDPENYEARCVVISGDSPDIDGPALGVYHNIGEFPTPILWKMTVVNTVAPIDIGSGEWDISIRRVGQPEVTKRVNLQLIVEGDA